MANRALKSAPRADSEADSRGDRTRRLIKETIARLAMRKDVADITLAEICKAAKLTTGAVYFHFKGKEEAVEEMVIGEVQAHYGQILAEYAGGGFEELVGVILEVSSRYHLARKRLKRAIVVIINARPAAYQAWLAARRPVVRALEQAIAERRREQGLPTDPAPYLALFILNSIEDLAMDVFQWKNPTLAPFAEDMEAWNRRQRALWTFAILAPIPDR
ncbi:MAG TPA: TetR/AcrR family transcriptional regulator [Caulobacteraceae bacterium]|nr:TetR/AcrR family transcriptional regulator [Caulobacteraceae bacterium]